MIPYGRQDVSEKDVEAVVRVLQSDWLTTGPAVEQFEHELSSVIGGLPVVAVSSGTAALHAAYYAAGLGPGDEVITPPITFVATQAVAKTLGAQVVFADVCEDTANIDPRAVEAAVTPRTKAIVAVDYAGHPADLESLRHIADKHGLLLIEDAAHSLGSSIAGSPVGSIADLTAFSFYPTKNITTAEGGAVAARNRELLDRAKTFSRQGLVRDPDLFRIQTEGQWHQEVQEFGLNYRLPDVLAALGLSQLQRLEGFRRTRAGVKQKYDEIFLSHAELRTPVQRPGVQPMWHLYPLLVPARERRGLFEFLRASGIAVQVNYMPAYWHPAFESSLYPRGLCPVAEAFYAREISLPLHVRLTDAEIDQVASVVLNGLNP